MDRRAKKIEKKRKQRTTAKKKSRAQRLHNEAIDRTLVKSAAQAPAGPCWISAGWDDLTSPALVNVVVTRKLANGKYLPAVALVDRTCLGIKDAYASSSQTARELDDFIREFAELHGGMHVCELPTAQSVVFHAIDYARKLGFEPHRDFPASLFGARPPELEATPWHAAERPQYFAGPHDDVQHIIAQLRASVGDNNFDCVLGADFEADDDDFEEDYRLDEADDSIIDTVGETVVASEHDSQT